MIFKKKRIFFNNFLLIFLIFLQSCSGGRIGNFLESSFKDLEKTSQVDDLQKNLINKNNLINDNKKINDKNLEKTKKVEEQVNIQENKKDKNLEKTKKVEEQVNIQENKKDENSEKLQKQKNNKSKNSSKKRKIELQSYKIIFILKDVDPKYPTEDLSTILKNSEVNFEIEKIERILDSNNKTMKKNKL